MSAPTGFRAHESFCNPVRAILLTRLIASRRSETVAGSQDADLEKRGSHPSLGVVTLSQLLATWAAHDLTHLHQISRVMAHQYRELVGPWTAYLGVMQCDGHSE